MVVAAAFRILLLLMFAVGLVTFLDRTMIFGTPRLPVFRNDFDDRISEIPRLREPVFSLSQFGGVGDGSTLNTRAFNEAVDAIRDAGSGQLIVRTGVWLTAPFNLTSHMTLFLAQGAVIMAVQDEDLWPVLPPLPSYGRGRDLSGPRYGSFIHGEELDDVVITGTSSLNSNSKNFLSVPFTFSEAVQLILTSLPDSQTTGHNGTIDGQGKRWWYLHERGQLRHTRGSLIEFLWCSNIEISDVNLENSPFWTLHPYDSRNITIRRVNVFAPEGAPNTAGIVPDSCRDVLVENCYISVGDDCIAIKSGWDQYGIDHGQPSMNIVIRHITARSYTSAGVSIGSEMSAGVSNVTVTALHVFRSATGVIIKTTLGRGGYVKNIKYNNILLEDVKVGVVINTNYGEHPDSLYDPEELPVLSNISYHGVHGRRVTHFARVYGSEKIPVRGLKFSDVDVHVLPAAASRKRSINTSRCSFPQGRSIGLIFPYPCEALSLE